MARAAAKGAQSKRELAEAGEMFAGFTGNGRSGGDVIDLLPVSRRN